MKLSLIVPIYNEEMQLESVVKNLMTFPCPIEREWIFVDDCSKDNSKDILKKTRRTVLLQASRATLQSG